MRSRRVPTRLPCLLVVAACCGGFAPSVATAADKTAVACIQSAEDGETARKAGELVRARALFGKCQARECPTVLRHDCASWFEDTERQIPSIVPGAHDAAGRDVVDVRVSVDGAAVRDHLDGSPLELDPGSHVLRFESAGVPPAEIQLVLRTGEKNRAVVANLVPPAPAAPPVPPPPPSRPPPPSPVPPEPARHVPAGAWLLGGLGVAAFGVFAYFGARGASDANTLRGTCAPGCASSQVDAVRAKLVTADVALGVGSLSIIAATWIGIHGLTRSRTAAWDVFVSPSRASVAVSF